MGIHKNAVSRWLKQGLRADTDKRPFLIRGDELIRFLKARQEGKKRKCGVNEFYCFKCRTPREAYLGMADVKFESPTKFRLSGVCAVCDTAVNKVQSAKHLPKILRCFGVQQLAGRHLIERADPSVKCALEGFP